VTPLSETPLSISPQGGEKELTERQRAIVGFVREHKYQDEFDVGAAFGLRWREVSDEVERLVVRGALVWQKSVHGRYLRVGDVEG
jgi:hypothetical protein